MILYHDRLLTVANNALCCALFEHRSWKLFTSSFQILVSNPVGPKVVKKKKKKTPVDLGHHKNLKENPKVL